ncbi:MAG: hypothetical protein ACYC3A_05735 [Halothiobacillus sp.]
MSKQAITTLTLPGVASGVVAQYRAVGFNGAQATVQGQKVQGISHWAAAAAGDVLLIDCAGTAIAETGAVFAKGDSLIVDSQGRVIPSTGALSVAAGATAVTSTAANGAILTGGNLPEYVFADALEASTAAGQFVEIFLRR